MKYELIHETTYTASGKQLFRIKALKSFGDVKKGDLGGYVESELNLSQEGNCWIYGFAKAYDQSALFENASIDGRAEICDRVLLKGNVKVYSAHLSEKKIVLGGDAEISGNLSITNGGAEDKVIVSGDYEMNGNLSITTIPESSLYYVHVKQEYVWDAQAYLGDKLPEYPKYGEIYMSSDLENNWWDVKGSVLLMRVEADSMDEVWNEIQKAYPEADKQVFEIVKSTEKPYHYMEHQKKYINFELDEDRKEK